MRVITYGTFDLFHEGHRRLLDRAKQLGDELIVAVTTENFDEGRGKLNVRESLMERIKHVESTGLADRIIIEEYEGQKVHDIQRYGVDIFAVGSDWIGFFDYLKDYCDVIYLERTQGVSSTELRNASSRLRRFGVAGAGHLAERFVAEARFVSGIEVDAVYSRTWEAALEFQNRHELSVGTDRFEDLLADSDAVFLATPPATHAAMAREAIDRGVHVLSQKPLALSATETSALYEHAAEKGVVVLEALNTAYSPGFQRLIAVAHSGAIGRIRSVDATFTAPSLPNGAGTRPPEGAIAEMASYPLLAAVKLLGRDYRSVTSYSWLPDGSPADLFSRIDLTYGHALASARVNLGVMGEDELVVSGTNGWVYVPAPWWRTESFELRFEDSTQNRKYFCKFDGDGLRYGLAEFVTLIHDRKTETFKLSPRDSSTIAQIIEDAKEHVIPFA